MFKYSPRKRHLRYKEFCRPPYRTGSKITGSPRLLLGYQVLEHYKDHTQRLHDIARPQPLGTVADDPQAAFAAISKYES